MNESDNTNDHDLEEYIEIWQTVGDVSYLHSLCQRIDTDLTPESINDYLRSQGQTPISTQLLAAMLQERDELIHEFYGPSPRPLANDFPSLEAYKAAYAIHRQEKKAQRAAHRTTRRQRRAKR
jgi:hypothetical protein